MLFRSEVVDLIRAYEIEAMMFDLKKIRFKKYHWSNRNFFYTQKSKMPFSNLDKNIIVFNLLRTIRNRAFHWENLLKTREIKGVVFPRITTIYPSIAIKEKQARIGVMPEMILAFLDDLIDMIGNEEINKNTRKALGI